jgi:hypothetical protein
MSGDGLFERISVKIGFSFMRDVTNHFRVYCEISQRYRKIERARQKVTERRMGLRQRKRRESEGEKGLWRMEEGEEERRKGLNRGKGIRKHVYYGQFL